MQKRDRVPAPPIAEGVSGARRRLAQILIATRSPDPSGAFAAVAEDTIMIKLLAGWPGHDLEGLWSELIDRVRDLVEAQHGHGSAPPPEGRIIPRTRPT